MRFTPELLGFGPELLKARNNIFQPNFHVKYVGLFKNSNYISNDQMTLEDFL